MPAETEPSLSTSPPLEPLREGRPCGGAEKTGRLKVIDLGRMAYGAAYQHQCDHLEEVLAGRPAAADRQEGPQAGSRAGEGREIGRILLVEHDAVVTIGRRPGAARHLVATPELLSRHGVSVVETDRGGDITYHGPGQLVCYPIIDLNTVTLGLHSYRRLLEDAVMAVCRGFGIDADRDTAATGVWAKGRDGGPDAKICAMGVRVRRWITMHGLALNVTTNLEHFKLIVPCGLSGRPVTSMAQELHARGRACPGMDEVKSVLVEELAARLR